MKRSACAALVLVAAALAGCAGEEPLSPPEARAGVDSCEVCGMMISDTRFAAAIAVREPNGMVRRAVYDDVGEMLADAPPASEHKFYVMTFDAGAWREAPAAVYVHSDRVMSPMATGVAAFTDRGAAEAFAAEHSGVVLSLAEARAKAAAGELRVGAEARIPE